MAHSDPLFIRFAISKAQDLHKLHLSNFVFTWRQQSTPTQFKFALLRQLLLTTPFACGGNLALPNMNTTQYGIRFIKFYGAN